MRTLDRNKKPFYYRLFQARFREVDENGDYTGEWKVLYTDPVRLYGNISAATGNAELEHFGTGVSYDKTLILQGVDYQITETTVLYIDVLPVIHTSDEAIDPTKTYYTFVNGQVTKVDEPVLADIGTYYEMNEDYDYTVTKVAPSLNNTALAISQVRHTE